MDFNMLVTLSEVNLNDNESREALQIYCQRAKSSKNKLN